MNSEAIPAIDVTYDQFGVQISINRLLPFLMAHNYP